MALNFGGIGLFNTRPFEDIGYEEQADEPILAPGDVTFWHSTGTTTEKQLTDNSVFTIDHANDRVGQSFTMGYSFIYAPTLCIKFGLKLYRVGSPGTMELNMYAVDSGGEPTGASLIHGFYDGDTLTTNVAGEEVFFTWWLDETKLIQPGDFLCVVLKAAGSGAGDEVKVRYSSSGSYGTGTEYGTALVSDDNGATWTRPAGTDLFFRLFGSGDYFIVNMAGTTKAISMPRLI
ncbi:MAG: hypothetical protein DRP42_03865 [Tenericutes bacterium]|nr:MAG: hypothetical protein DRP42_03865 [Mycoplasmatota bacterium]